MFELALVGVVVLLLAGAALAFRRDPAPELPRSSGALTAPAAVLADCNEALGGHGDVIEGILQIEVGELDLLVFLNDDARFTVSCLNTVRKRRLALDFELASSSGHPLPMSPVGERLCVPTMQLDEFDHLVREAPLSQIEALLVASDGSLHVTHEEVEFECTLVDPDPARAAALVTEVAALTRALRDIPGLWN